MIELPLIGIMFDAFFDKLDGLLRIDIRQDRRPGRRSLNAPGSAESAEAVASSCLRLLVSAAWAFAASLAAISARTELWSS